MPSDGVRVVSGRGARQGHFDHVVVNFVGDGFAGFSVGVALLLVHAPHVEHPDGADEAQVQAEEGKYELQHHFHRLILRSRTLYIGEVALLVRLEEEDQALGQLHHLAEQVDEDERPHTRQRVAQLVLVLEIHELLRFALVVLVPKLHHDGAYQYAKHVNANEPHL